AVLVERGHHRRAGGAAAVLSELEEAAERRRRHAAEEVVLDRGRRAERLVRDAGRDPGEEVLHGERRRVTAWDAQDETLEELEEVLHVEDLGRRVVGGDGFRSAVRRTAALARRAVPATEPAAAGERVEAVVTDRARELAAQEGAVPADAVALVERVGRRPG